MGEPEHPTFRIMWSYSPRTKSIPDQMKNPLEKAEEGVDCRALATIGVGL
jgi:hypothetical protein